MYKSKNDFQLSSFKKKKKKKKKNALNNLPIYYNVRHYLSNGYNNILNKTLEEECIIFYPFLSF